MLFHITSALEAERARQLGEYAPQAFSREGFIHCSYGEQVIQVANRLFGGRADLVLLEIDPQRLSCPVVDENLEGGMELFPHIYGPVPMTAVVAVHPFPCDDRGRFQAIW
jgi:uncharacterized protein (DUF952 family)